MKEVKEIIESLKVLTFYDLDIVVRAAKAELLARSIQSSLKGGRLKW
jgi:hypothetical protein